MGFLQRVETLGSNGAQSWNDIDNYQRSNLIIDWIEENGDIRFLSEYEDKIFDVMIRAYDDESESNPSECIHDVGRIVFACFAGLTAEACDAQLKRIKR